MTQHWLDVVPKDKAERHRWMGIILRASIAYQVRAARLIRAWSREELAKRAELSVATINRVEDPSGDTNLTMETLLKIARAFDVALLARFSSWPEFVEQMGASIPPAPFPDAES